MRLRKSWMIVAVSAICTARATFADETPSPLPDQESADTVMAVSPLLGWNRNEMRMGGERGHATTETDTAPEYGLFFLVVHKNLVFTDFAFVTDANHTDVFGNLAFANLYGDRKSRVTWNVGAGHLYHTIEPAHEDITVNVPMVKAGPLVKVPEWNLTLNPYVGYAWERVETQHANVDNNSTLYGLTIGWRWRMLAATLKYYYQDSREADDDYETVRARAHCMFNGHWGAIVRIDYMEHVTSDDTSVLLGPVYVF